MRIVLNHALRDIIAVVRISRRAVLLSPLLAAAAPANPFRGIFPIVQTPFGNDGALDLPVLVKEIGFLGRCGVQGMAWPQLASEFWSLTTDERLQGADTILKAGRGNAAKIVIGVQADDPDVSVRLAKHASANGADALISLPPAGIGMTEFFKKVASAAPERPIFLQAVGKVSVDEVIELSRVVPALRFVKDEAGVTLPRISEFRTKSPGLGIFTGAHGRTMIDELLRGAAGNMPAAGPADLYTRAFRLWEQGKRKEAALAFARAAVLVPEFEQYGIEGLKYLLVLRGVFPNHVVRGPRNGDVGAVATRTRLDEEGKAALRLLWEAVGK